MERAHCQVSPAVLLSQSLLVSLSTEMTVLHRGLSSADLVPAQPSASGHIPNLSLPIWDPSRPPGSGSCRLTL